MSHRSAFPPIGQSFIILPTIDSTNNYAMAMAKMGKAIHGDVFFTLEQSAGKGQRGKKWDARTGQNILLSVVIQPSALTINQVFLLSAATALAACEFCKKYLGEGGCRIKWPNDLYWQDRKAGGILIENSVQGNSWFFSIVGIGINVNQESFEPSLAKAVSFRQITGKSFDVIALGKDLCGFLNHWFDRLITGSAFDLMHSYNESLFKIHERVRMRKAGEEFETRILGVDGQGFLLVEGGPRASFASGEVEWLI